MRFSNKPVSAVSILIGLLLLVVGCATGVGAAALSQPAPVPYTPQTHIFTVTAVPQVVHEMQGQSVTKTSFVATKPGIYTFICDEAEHSPYMWGQLVVLPDPTSN